jgi:predicted peptidase
VFCSPVFADCTEPCQNLVACPNNFSLVTYFQNDNVDSCHFPGHASGCNNQRASCFGTTCKIQLQGYIYFPSTPKPRTGYPAIVFSHGSSQDYPHFPSYYCTVVSYFVGKGYVVFMPYRRGYALSPDASIKNTGSYIDDWLSEICNGSCNYQQKASELLEAEGNDVDDAVTFLRNQYIGIINLNAIAVMGHSLGGIVSIFVNQTSFASFQKCAVSISGAAESWSNTYLQDDLKRAVDNAQTPLFFLQPKNDVDISPTVELSYEAGKQKHRYEAAIYRNVAYANDGECAHSCFVSDNYYVGLWGNTVLDFLQRHNVK